jgi:hypothetical protein
LVEVDGSRTRQRRAGRAELHGNRARAGKSPAAGSAGQVLAAS